MTQFNFRAIGTLWQIDLFQDLSKEYENLLFLKIQNRIDEFDKVYSRFRTDSTVTKMSKETGNFSLPHDSKLLFSVYRDLYLRTNGYFTPIMGDLLSDAGYDANYSLKPKKELRTPPEWDEVMKYKENNLEIKKTILLDFGAAGKGYLIDLASNVLEENGVSKYCIDAGGDILYKNDKPMRIGLENPENSKEVIGVSILQKGSICGSAGNRRVWANFTHILNPKTLVSPTETLAIWVVADTALVADALTTCLFFVDAKTLSDAYDFQYLILRKDHTIEKSDGFKGEVFAV